MVGIQKLVHKEVSGEERLLNFFLPVFPAAPYFQSGEKGLNPLFFQALKNHFFMPASGMQAIPVCLSLFDGHHFFSRMG
jgi:hypothetical protein